MRRTDREVTDFNRMLAILQKCDCCRIGFKEKEGAYIVPLNFGFEATEQKLVLYFHGAKAGKKAELIAKEPIVGFELDTGHALITGKNPCAFSFLYQSIIGKGRIRFLQEKEEKIKALKAIINQYSSDECGQFTEQMLHSAAVMELEVTAWSCKEHC